MRRGHPVRRDRSLDIPLASADRKEKLERYQKVLAEERISARIVSQT